MITVEEFDKLFREFYGDPLTFTKQRQQVIYKLAKTIITTPDLEEEKFINEYSVYFFLDRKTIRGYLQDARLMVNFVEKLKDKKTREMS